MFLRPCVPADLIRIVFPAVRHFRFLFSYSFSPEDRPVGSRTGLCPSPWVYPFPYPPFSSPPLSIETPIFNTNRPSPLAARPNFPIHPGWPPLGRIQASLPRHSVSRYPEEPFKSVRFHFAFSSGTVHLLGFVPSSSFLVLLIPSLDRSGCVLLPAWPECLDKGMDSWSGMVPNTELSCVGCLTKSRGCRAGPLGVGRAFQVPEIKTTSASTTCYAQFE